jgi:arylsulfatase A-like enzyme
MQGRSLRPLLVGETPPTSWRHDWFYEHRLELPETAASWGFRGIPKSEGLRDDRYKYLVYYDSPEPNELLFDLEKDPYEEHDLSASADPALLARLAARLAELRAQARGTQVSSP